MAVASFLHTMAGDALTQLDQLIAAIAERTNLSPPISMLTSRRFPPLTSSQLERAQERLGYALPPILRRLYLEVGMAVLVLGMDC